MSSAASIRRRAAFAGVSWRVKWSEFTASRRRMVEWLIARLRSFYSFFLRPCQRLFPIREHPTNQWESARQDFHLHPAHCEAHDALRDAASVVAQCPERVSASFTRRFYRIQVGRRGQFLGRLTCPFSSPHDAQRAGHKEHGAALFSARREVMMRALSYGGVLLLGGILGLPSATVLRSQALFAPGCPMPFTPEPHDIDNKCARQGDPNGSAEGKLQNEFKTNYCATEGPIEVTAVSFRALQLSADTLKQEGALRYGSPQAPPRVNERPLLSDLHITNPAGESVGEGKLVRMAAYLLHAAYSGGESVNCNSASNPIVPSSHEYADIHIYLSAIKPTRYTSAAARMKQDCRSMTAEIIPHLRPDDFTKIAAFHDTQGGGKAFDAIAAAKLNRPMRFTGHMFFDGAHTPCSSDSDQFHLPRRFASWEIHPVYAIDVCKFTTKAKCRVDHDTDWTSFKQWMDVIEGDEP